MHNDWFVYILECSDGSLYTGIAKDPLKRLIQHNSGKGSKYVRSRTPAKIVWTSQKYENRSLASMREAQIKDLNRVDKLSIITTNNITEVYMFI